RRVINRTGLEESVGLESDRPDLEVGDQTLAFGRIHGKDPDWGYARDHLGGLWRLGRCSSLARRQASTDVHRLTQYCWHDTGARTALGRDSHRPSSYRLVIVFLTD